MRDPGKLLLLTALLSGLLGLQAVPASAATSRTVSAAVSTSTPTVGATISMSGKVSRSPKGTVVHVQRRSGSSWVKVAGTRTTSSAGSYRVSFKVPTKPAAHSYRAYAPRTSRLRVAASATRSVDVRRKVSITSAVSRSSVEQGTSPGPALSGKVTPGVVGATVTIQRVASGKASTVGTTQVRSGGAYSYALPTSTVGTRTYRATMPGRKGYAAATSASRALTVTALPAVTTTSLPQGTPGTAYSTTLASNQPAGTAGTWAVTSGTLPSGLSLDASTGRISGTPRVGGASTGLTITFTVARTGRATAPRALSLTVRDLIATASLPAALVGVAYDAQLARHGTAAGGWSATGLPTGLAVSPEGRVTGTPTQAGEFTPSVIFTPDDSAVVPASRSYRVTARVVTPPVSPTATTVSVGSQFACRVTTAADLACWGYNFQGNLGRPIVLQQQKLSTPQAVAPGGGWRSVSAGLNFHMCAVRTDHSLWCAGDNDYGKLGDGGGRDVGTPVRIKPDVDWSTVSAGADHTCAVTVSGELWCWGGDSSGQLGQWSTTFERPTPQQVGGSDWSTVSAGNARTCATKTDGSLWCWGIDDGPIPKRIDSAAWRSIDARAAQARAAHLCGIQTDGTLWCWGSNVDGQLGVGDRTSRSVPTKVGSRSDWATVAVGGADRGLEKFTCATTTSGEAWCWGANGQGQLGAASGASTVPARVDQTTTWQSVSAGDQSACGVRTDGTQFCWGQGSFGQLGNGFDTSPVRFPVQVKVQAQP